MKAFVFVAACAVTALLAQDASAAVKYQRFARCPEGLVSAKTCECHAGTSGRFHYCHSGQYCHFDGTCHP